MLIVKSRHKVANTQESRSTVSNSNHPLSYTIYPGIQANNENIEF